MEIGTLFRAGRIACGLTQEQLAEAVGVSSNYVNMVENNKRTPGRDAIFRFAKTLNLSLDEIYGIDTGRTFSPDTGNSIELTKFTVKKREDGFLIHIPVSPERMKNIFEACDDIELKLW